MSFPASQASAPLARASGAFPVWLLDAVRGFISLGLGVGLLFWRQQTLFIILALLVANLVVDGGFDVLSYLVRNRQRNDIGVSHVLIGLLSLVAAALIVFWPSVAFAVLTLILYLVAARAALHGIVDIWELLTSFWQRHASLILLARGVAWLLFSALLFLAPIFALKLALVLIGLSLLIDALGSFASAVVKRRQRAAPQAEPTVPMDSDALAQGPRALVFVRRSGALGLGHVGWAFEWGSGYFNTGSVENISGAAFSPPSKMGFWTANTPRPVTTMLERPIAYDAFKVFYVPQPHPEAAWKAVIWLSRQPYWALRRNCSDCVYDVLRAYGVTHLIDTAQENVPNSWYDALPGPSYPIEPGADLPSSLAQGTKLADLPLPARQLTIAETVRVEPPPWRTRGGRVWYEAQQRLESVARRTYTYLAEIVARARKPSQTRHDEQRADG